eukprot:TRINITY_DN31718_c0_g1_i1.p1 TRINITY_DN31718_c0_g1~~TRINITY_DN31718_c0_g1_i1.p1  ORF type:complete len:100 (+),score=17.59 TRINITY_DN31718_c0_g1_i1:214-513(+)
MNSKFSIGKLLIFPVWKVNVPTSNSFGSKRPVVDDIIPSNNFNFNTPRYGRCYLRTMDELGDTEKKTIYSEETDKKRTNFLAIKKSNVVYRDTKYTKTK